MPGVGGGVRGCVSSLEVGRQEVALELELVTRSMEVDDGTTSLAPSRNGLSGFSTAPNRPHKFMRSRTCDWKIIAAR
jgi:hypothetical protein